MKKPTEVRPIVDFDGKPSPEGFKGYVNPDQRQTITYGPKSNGPSKVAKPGEKITLTKVEFENLKRKGLDKTLLVNSLPKTTKAEPAKAMPAKS